MEKIFIITIVMLAGILLIRRMFNAAKKGASGCAGKECSSDCSCGE